MFIRPVWRRAAPIAPLGWAARRSAPRRAPPPTIRRAGGARPSDSVAAPGRGPRYLERLPVGEPPERAGPDAHTRDRPTAAGTGHRRTGPPGLVDPDGGGAFEGLDALHRPAA